MNKKKMKWTKGSIGSIPAWHLEALATLWLGGDDKWTSNSPPLAGMWDTLEAGQTAIVDFLRKQAIELLERLP